MGEEASSGDPGEANWRFATTHWSVVLAAGEGESGQADRALEELCRAYWYPLYAFVRRSGHAAADAEDLTQEFFARLIAKRHLSAVRRERGRFRGFLLLALQRFLINERERSWAAKRGGRAVHIPFDGEKAEERYRLDAADWESPDRLFDRAWAMNVVQRTYRRLEEESTLEGRGKPFERLIVFLSGDKAGQSYAEAGASLGMSEGAVKVAVHRLRRRYRELLRDEVAQTVRGPAELEEELRNLRAVFAG